MAPWLKKILGMNWLLIIAMYAILVFGVYTIESAARHLPGGGAAIAAVSYTHLTLPTTSRV